MKKKASSLFRFMLVATALLMALTLREASIFMLLGMLPSVVAYIVDKGPRRHIFATVAMMNLAGVFPYLLDIGLQPRVGTATVQALNDPMVWFFMYSAAAMGWVLVWLMPVLCGFGLHIAREGKVMKLEAECKKLLQEWGPEVQRKPS